MKRTASIRRAGTKAKKETGQIQAEGHITMTNIFPTTKRTGILFRQGCYGAKGNYTDADLDAMAGTRMLPIRMSHHVTPIELAGKMGHCNRTYTGYDESGQKVLFGEWDEPLPLTQMLGDFPRSLSVEIELATKQIRAVALEVTPAIKDAAFFSQAVERAYVKFSRGEAVAPLGAAGCIDWAEVDRARKENNLPSREKELNHQIANEIIARREREAN
jgi:hypothetical protein